MWSEMWSEMWFEMWFEMWSMGWHGRAGQERLRGDVGLPYTAGRSRRGRGGLASKCAVKVCRGAAKWQRDGSLTAGDAAWTWATKPSIHPQHGTPVARGPGRRSQ